MLFQRELESINRAIKFAKIGKMCFRIDYLAQVNKFTIEFVEPKKGGKSFKVKDIDPKHVHYHIDQTINKVQKYIEDSKNGQEKV